MAYDHLLAVRIRALIPDELEVTERKMFGGLAFLVGGHLAVAASGQGGLLVRTDPAATDRLLASTPGAEPMVMRGRPMRGWLRIPPDALTTDDALANWVGTGTGYAGSLAPKAGSGAAPENGAQETPPPDG